MSGGQKRSKNSRSLGGPSGSSPLRLDGSHDGQAGGWTVLVVAKSVKIRVGNDSRPPSDLLKNSSSDNLKKSQVTLSQGMLKKGDVYNETDVDNAVRISASRKRATAMLSTEEFFHRTQYL